MAKYQAQRLVEFRDTDAAGMMHFTAMFGYMESVEHEFLRSLGLSVKMEDTEGTLSWPRVAVQCDYQGVVGFEDLLDVELAIERIGSKSITYCFNVTCGERATARGSMTAVCCRMTTQGPISTPIPESLVEKLRPYLQPCPPPS